MKILSTSTVLIMVFCGAGIAAFWALLNTPYEAPDWPDNVSGFAFSPYQVNQDNLTGPQPSVEEIDTDLALLSGFSQGIRTYTAEGVFYEIPRLAAKHDIDVTLGAWLDNQPYTNIQEVHRVIALSEAPNVSRILVGNEVLLRKELSLAELTSYLDQVKHSVDKPVSTAETWSTWLEYPQLAEHVDFIAVHILPYWEGLDVSEALNFTVQRVEQIQARFPDKPVLIAEVGWPSEGRTRHEAVGSGPNQALFIRHFLKLAEEQGYDYFLMEAFDQPWKRRDEGSVGAHWGMFDVERQAKFAFTGPILKIPAWQSLVLFSVLLGFLILIPFLHVSRTLTNLGKTLLAMITYSLVALVLWLLTDYITMYMSASSIVSGMILLMLMLGILILILSESHEWVEAHWVSHRLRPLQLNPPKSIQQPMVSIHVPAFNEPPAMLIETLNALSRLDYDNFEVIVIDNNTQDETIWRPVEAHCKVLGSKFQFYHVAPLNGYKAGALNYALKKTHATASIVAVIDSDYVVDPDWLSQLSPAFEDTEVAIVQAPQDYRDETLKPFKLMCDAEYQGFFEIGMITRNERNAIIQHGTMTMIRREVLEQVGAWAEWCITEDAELGLRIFQHGYKASYTSESFGRGLTPDTFLDYKKQRYRWAYGAMQILKKNWRELLCLKKGKLSPGQRYHFLAGWLPWLAQGANLLFCIMSIVWSIGMITSPTTFEVPHMAFSIFPILFFSFNLIKLFHLYLARLKVSPVKALAAGIAGLSLSYTVGKAMLAGLFTNNQPFIRTPKMANPHALSVAIASAFEEILFLIAFLLLALILRSIPHISSPDYSLWLGLLLIQAMPYAAALLTSLISAYPMYKPHRQTKELIRKKFEVDINKN